MTSSSDFADGCTRLYADIGGTNARFALSRAPHELRHLRTIACSSYPELGDAAQDYLRSAAEAGEKLPAYAAIAIATHVEGDSITMTNHHWSFSVNALRQKLGLQSLQIYNDFTALAMSLPQLQNDEKEAIGGGEAKADAPIALLGAGTGLGVSGLIPTPAGEWLPLNTEGGHVLFAPANALEAEILHYCWQEFNHVSAERLLSGPGLERLHRSLAAIRGKSGNSDARSVSSRHNLNNDDSISAPQIVEHARNNSCPLCLETTQIFSEMLGAFAANLALSLGSLGGVYLGGGVVQNMGHTFNRQRFRQQFKAKGRFSSYLANIPVWLVTARYPALKGVAALLERSLRGST